MIISSRKKFIFFHTPKVAGSSLNAALRKYANIPSSRFYNYLLDYVGTSKFFGVYPRHISPFQLSKYLPEEKFNTYTKFAFVRNPFDWHVSQYHFHRQNDFAVFFPLFKKMDFNEYLVWAKDNVHLSKSNQYEFLSDENGQLMVDFIGKIETIEKSFEEIKAKLGIKAKLPHRNKSTRSDSYRQYYSDLGIELVNELNSKDLAFFGYSF